ncbi:hypothetical protein LXL04_007506 [Taraxacum kok-saghyz]
MIQICPLFMGTFGHEAMEVGGATEMQMTMTFVCVQPPKTWTPWVEDKPYKGQLFPSFEDAFGYYKEYAFGYLFYWGN